MNSPTSTYGLKYLISTCLEYDAYLNRHIYFEHRGWAFLETLFRSPARTN